MNAQGCSHLNAIAIDSIKQPQRRECEECVKIGSYWVHLRTARHVELLFAATARQISTPANTHMPVDIR